MVVLKPAKLGACTTTMGKRPRGSLLRVRGLPQCSCGSGGAAAVLRWWWW